MKLMNIVACAVLVTFPAVGGEAKLRVHETICGGSYLASHYFNSVSDTADVSDVTLQDDIEPLPTHSLFQAQQVITAGMPHAIIPVNDQYIAVGSYFVNKKNGSYGDAIYIYDFEHYNPVSRLKNSQSGLYRGRLSVLSSNMLEYPFLYSAYSNNCLKEWDIEKCTCRQTVRRWGKARITCGAALSGTQIFVSCWSDGALGVWDSRDSSVQSYSNRPKDPKLAEETKAISQMCVLSDGIYVATSLQKSPVIHLWDIRNVRSVCKRIDAHYAPIKRLCAIEDNLLVSAGADDLVKVWDTTRCQWALASMPLQGDGGIVDMAASEGSLSVLSNKFVSHLTLSKSGRLMYLRKKLRQKLEESEENGCCMAYCGPPKAGGLPMMIAIGRRLDTYFSLLKNSPLQVQEIMKSKEGAGDESDPDLNSYVLVESDDTVK